MMDQLRSAILAIRHNETKTVVRWKRSSKSYALIVPFEIVMHPTKAQEFDGFINFFACCSFAHIRTAKTNRTTGFFDRLLYARLLHGNILDTYERIDEDMEVQCDRRFTNTIPHDTNNPLRSISVQYTCMYKHEY